MRWTRANSTAKVNLLAAEAHGPPLHAPGEKEDNQMRNRTHLGAAVVFVSFLLTSLGRAQEPAAATPTNDAILQHMQELERQVKELQTEVATLKGAPAATATAAPAVPQSNLVSSASSGAAPAPPSLAGLLGPTSLSGFVDVYYGQNFNNPSNRSNSLRFFDGATNQFGLNLVELVVDKAPDPSNSRTGYHVALGFGQAMNAVNGSEPQAGLGFDQYLKEAYFSYLAPVGKGLQVDVGKFVTPHGAEVIETKDNWNYSRGILFSYAIPYYHFGMRAKYAFNDKYSLNGFFVNGWNNVVDNNTGKTYGIGFNWNPNKKFGIAQNYMAGPEQNGINSTWRQLSDTVISYSPNSKLSFIVNGDYGRGDRVDLGEGLLSKPVYWTGVAGYIKYAFNGTSAFSTRYEYYNDHDGFTTGSPTGLHFNEFTTTFERIVAHHVISRFEFRRDMSNGDPFLKGTTPVGSQNTMTAGLVYTFDSREGK
ncbi:MAG: outer membrane beta-barrel protein [Acidobacteriia bacterium]|nr:outer membrane beta-barrel protein [Terriglobia bacterium]